MKHFQKFFWIGLIVLMACVTDAPIVHDLTERDANEIWVLLSKNNIVASKKQVEKNQEITWTISVKSSDEMQARNLLVANNLPRVRQGGLESICGIKVGTFILTPKQEKCREVLGKKGDIINMLEQLPGVVSAEVVLNLPEKDTFTDENTVAPRPTAAVVIRYLDNGLTVTKLTEGKVQELVAGSIDGLDARDVNVVISQLDYNAKTSQPENTTNIDPNGVDTDEATTSATENGEDGSDENLTKVAGLSLDAASAKKLKVIGALFLLLFLLMAVAFIVVLLKMSGMRKQASVPTTSGPNDSDQKLLEA